MDTDVVDAPVVDTETAKTQEELPTSGQEQLAQQQQNLEQQLIALETLHGPYHSSIAENLINLGRIYAQQGEHKLARDTFERSLEVHRRNSGLHNLEQIPIVEQLVKINRALKQWQSVDANYEYLYWLHRRVYGEDSPQLLPMLSHLTYWKVEAINGLLLGNPEKVIRQARNAARRANKIVEKHPELEQWSINLIAESDTF